MSRCMLWLTAALTPVAVCAGQPQQGGITPTASNRPASLSPPEVDVQPPESLDPAPNADQQVGLPGTTRPRVAPATKRSVGGWPGAEGVPWYRSGLVSLAVVLAVIAGVSLLIRRVVPSVRGMSGGAIQVLARSHLAPKQSLTLVRVGRRVLLVGVTSERITVLTAIDDPQEVAEVLGSGGALAAEGRFEEALGQASNAFEASEPDVGELARGTSRGLIQAKGQMRGLMSRLRSMQAKG